MNFLYFLHFFDKRSGKADDCGTIKYYPHEIIIVTQKGQKWQKELRRLIRKIPLFNFLKFLSLESGAATLKILAKASVTLTGCRAMRKWEIKWGDEMGDNPKLE